MNQKQKLLELIDQYAEARHIQGHSTYNIKTAAARNAVIEALSGGQALSAAPAIKPLVWSDESGPTDKIRYNHVTAETALGQFSVEWKGWKEEDGPCVYLAGDYVGVASNLGGAKQLAEQHIRELVANLLAASPTPKAEQTSITPETGNSASAKGAAITSESGTPPAHPRHTPGTPTAEQQTQTGAVDRTGCTAGTDEECTRRGCATSCPAQQAAPKAEPGVGNNGFDHKTAADFLNGKTVSDEAVRKFVQASRRAHDEKAALSATLLAMHGVLASREAEIALLKKALLEAEAAPQPTSPAEQQAPSAAAADTVVLETALRAIQQAIDLIGEPDTERLRTVRRVLRGAVIVAEEAGEAATAPQPAPAPLSDDTKRLNWLLWKLPGDALRYVVGELSDTSSGAEFRAAIDAALAAREGK